MKMEQYEKAKQILDKIEYKKEFLKYFNSGGCNSITAYKSSGCCVYDCAKSISLSSEPELAEIIRSYIDNQVNELEKQLEEL